MWYVRKNSQMAGEQREGLPAEVNEWVEDHADSEGLSEDEVVARALSAYRYLVDDREADVERGERLASLDERVEDVEASFDEKLHDVRERVVQLKRELDEKADADHDHPALADLADRIDEVDDRVGDTDDRVEDLRSTVDDGFDNFEEVLTYLTDSTENLDEKVSILAGAAVDLRQRTVSLESDRSVRNAVADLREEANRHGETTAVCADCDTTVHVALLDEPDCPECGAVFDGIEPARGFFGSATLTVGERPALLGETEAVESPADLFEDVEAEGGEGEDERDDIDANDGGTVSDR